eukprot:scaffold1565_cov169-Ochromonas_danica.AAC.3
MWARKRRPPRRLVAKDGTEDPTRSAKKARSVTVTAPPLLLQPSTAKPDQVSSLQHSDVSLLTQENDARALTQEINVLAPTKRNDTPSEQTSPAMEATQRLKAVPAALRYGVRFCGFRASRSARQYDDTDAV